MAVTIGKKCIGCGVCKDVCPYSAIEIFEGQAIITGHCSVCGACAEVCPVAVIEITGVASEGLAPQNKDEWRGVCVIAETGDGSISPVTLELLREGRKIAGEMEQELSAVLIGESVKIHADKLVAHGADTVYVIDNPALKNRLVEPYMRALADLIVREKPSVVLAGATAWGRTLIPAVAAVLETGLTADCTGLRVNPETGLLEQTRPTFGGNLMATIVCPERRPQMATVRPHVFEKGEPESARQGSVVEVKLDDGVFSSTAVFVEKHTELEADEKIEDAEVIVAGGRGLGRPDNLKLLNDLARILHGAVGATRPLVDEGWLPYVRQIGQTGKTVCPKLYIACGISGAVQHAAGMSTSDIIVAVNKDQSAPIFDIADYGLIGDCEEILPALIGRLEQEEK